MTADVAHLRTTSSLTGAEVRTVLALAEAAARADGAHPLGEHVVLHLRHGSGPAMHLLAEDPDTSALLGYAHLDLSDLAEGPAAEVAVSPAARHRGVGGMLISEVVRLADQQPGRLRLWAHGNSAATGTLAAAHGLHQVRRLLQLRRSLFAPIEAVGLPPGITLRSFDDDRDIPDWLALNAAAFTDLPDQGGWTAEDLARRMAEPWFDPAGFLLAQQDRTLVGFHWTKVHSHDHGPGADHAHLHPHNHDEDPDHRHVHDPLGEVYVVGVHPEHRGRGLGRALTVAGLHHLRERGLSTALLYVDADNTGAIALYRSLGFAAWDSDTLFRR
ncbi:MAG: mycothiol synthase [Candidatus Nanopelagicales bacterium]